MGCSSSKDNVLATLTDEISLAHFNVERILGKGGMGTVNAVTLREITRDENGKLKVRKVPANKMKWFAMKSIDKYGIVQSSSYKAVFRERRLLAHLRHDRICTVHYCFQDDAKLFMVMDLLLGGDLRYQLKKSNGGKPMPEAQVKFYAAQMVLALEYLHGMNVIHRDIKPDNVLMDSEGNVKLTDFGIAYELDQEGRCSRGSGTAGYMAPEILNARWHSKPVDWFALGVMLIELLTFERPFSSDTIKKCRKSFKLDMRAKVKSALGLAVGKEGEQALTKMIDGDFKRRLGTKSIKEVKDHPWFTADDTFVWAAVSSGTASVPFVPDTKQANFEASHELLNVFIGDDEKSPVLTDEQQMHFTGFEFDVHKVNRGESSGHFFGANTDVTPQMTRMMSIDKIDFAKTLAEANLGEPASPTSLASTSIPENVPEAPPSAPGEKSQAASVV